MVHQLNSTQLNSTQVNSLHYTKLLRDDVEIEEHQTEEKKG